MSAGLSNLEFDLEPPSFSAENDVMSVDRGSSDESSDGSSDEGSDESSDIEKFLPVLNAIDLNALTSAAIDARSKT